MNTRTDTGGLVTSIGRLDGQSITFLDILLPPLLISLSLLIYDLTHPQLNLTQKRRAHLFQNTTHHARFLPPSARHRFHYTILQFGLDLDQLQSHQLDLPYLFGFLDSTSFTWRSPFSWFRFNPICSITPSDYVYELSPSTSQSKLATDPSLSIKAALLDQLRHHHQIDVEQLIDRVYLVTMPAYLGMGSMNPLSVYFCYRPSSSSTSQADHQPLSVIVLEVHNTFSERHLYVLTVGIDEEPRPQSGSAYPMFDIIPFPH